MLVGLFRVELDLDQPIVKKAEVAVVFLNASASKHDLRFRVIGFAPDTNREFLKGIIDVLGQLRILV